ncbi:MAG: cytochrome c [Anaerolineae bacterium]|nr:cytochrome c [Anaerolineae bacterium]
MKRLLAVTLVLAFSVLLSACGSTAAPTATVVPAPATAAPTAAPTLAPTDAPAATAAPVAAPDTSDAEGDPAYGAELFARNGCSGCHGAQAGGGGGPALAGRGLDVEFVLEKVRAGPGGMPAFSSDTIFDSDVYDIVAWLSTL